MNNGPANASVELRRPSSGGFHGGDSLVPLGRADPDIFLTTRTDLMFAPLPELMGGPAETLVEAFFGGSCSVEPPITLGKADIEVDRALVLSNYILSSSRIGFEELVVLGGDEGDRVEGASDIQGLDTSLPANQAVLALTEVGTAYAEEGLGDAVSSSPLMTINPLGLVMTADLNSNFECFTGPDILKWRSFYATQDNAWKAHYREVFDNGMREALCCLGRGKYLSMSEEDEVYSVARLLGDLVAYRASGTGHLELLAGLALLQRHGHSLKSFDDVIEAPEERIQEAAALHKFAVAAYTGPLLDIGRHPLFFPCAWLYRQGILTPWTRNRSFIHRAAHN
ncbi:hypothetical protein CMV_001942 [Castanea mollissima]|uniref:DUF7358 domain-containing protein n=1 Tax=Castanea mollissima TaxID=60419 RepID=A0A8J4RK03_9ROSI|nr:hypothetical protein CMV_001942 [Castanea mollissima]